ncbi:PREDICTED: uncharacterized protein LOC108552299, partial [Eufriesea mexicana]|uniref:uncharacterized protein LOC108552299 n=1 Tax=Eufriesea mexicana TaxID=516756 RepID=UPI00083C6CD8
NMTEINFGNLQMEERYKRLERTLKLASLNMKNREIHESCASSTSPSISSINADPIDSSTNNPFLHTLKIGSEVVSSSNNLRNILLKRNSINSDHKIIATSSIKKFNIENDCRVDRLRMPPPKSDSCIHNSKKPNNIETYTIAKSSPQNICRPFDNVIDSLKEKQNYKLQTNSKNVQNRNIILFTKWKVVLNEQGQLIIKGKVDCETIAWSKPIIRRLTNTHVESVFKHLYHLQGNIVDDEDELPDYVRGKFYNGFPDDWENVHQVWQTFVLQGCRFNFRWPTPITDSDDDIKSEATDFTFVSSESHKNKISNFKSVEEPYTLEAPVNFKCTNNIVQMQNEHNLHVHNGKCNSFIQTCISDEIEKSSCSKANIQSLTNEQYDNDKENYKQQENVNLNCCCVKNKPSKLKDKLNVIINNLTDKNYSQEDISKIIEVVDCLNYVVSHISIKEDESNVEDSKLMENRHLEEKRSNKVNDKSQENVQFESVPLQSSVDDKVIDSNNLLQKKRSFTEMITDNSCTSDSESEIYAGIPRIKRIIRQKETLLKPYRRKIREMKIHRKRDILEKPSTSNIPIITSDCTNESYIKRKSENQCGTKFNNSSSNIMADERNHLKVEEYVNSNIQSKPDQHLEYGTMEKRQWVDSSEFIKGKHSHKIKENFVQKDSVVIHRPINYQCDTYKVTEQNECKIAVTKRSENKMIEANSCIEACNEEEKKDMYDQEQNHLSCQQYKEFSSGLRNISETIKPVVISSVPVDIKIRNIQLQNSKVNLIENRSIAIQELDEENKSSSLTHKESPVKFNAVRKKSSNLLPNSKRYSEEHIKDQLSNMDSVLSKKSLQDNFKISEGNKSANKCKPKLLSAWTPRVVCKSGLHLIFEGKLLNEAGHVVNRRFKTDIILRRISPKLVETVHHEFYELIGDFSNSKHVIPKELLLQCRYGCPTRIEQFCRTWKSIKNNNIIDYVGASEKLNASLVDTVNVSVSSKGRRVIPSLSYWTGERIVLKDNDLVYDPGSSQEPGLINNSREILGKNIKKGKQGKNNSKKSSFYESEDASTGSPEKLRKTEGNKSKKFVMKNKRRTSQKVKELSDSNDDESSTACLKTVKITRNAVNVMDKQNTEFINIENLEKLNTAAEKSITKKLRARKNIEPNTSLISPSKQRNHQSSAEKYHDVYMYYQDIPDKDDILSDDQVSHVL